MNTRADSQALLKLDLGCGPHKRSGFLGVDSLALPGVDVVADLRQAWPWPDGSVGEVVCAHFVEHLEAAERIHFVNELYRVLAPGGKARIITPHWASARAYGDLTHKWPPVSEFWYKYLNKQWREKTPHNDFYTCDFDFALEYVLRDDVTARPDGEKMFAVMNFKEAVQDLVAILTRR
jgi:predicted SAM-dependent methyltransferase